MAWKCIKKCVCGQTPLRELTALPRLPNEAATGNGKREERKRGKRREGTGRMWKMGCVNGEGQEEDKGEGGQREKGYPQYLWGVGATDYGLCQWQQVYRRRYESRRSSKPKLHLKNYKKIWRKRFSIWRMELLDPALAMWHDHDIDFARWLYSAMWHVALESWQWIHQVAAPCNVIRGSGMTCRWIRPIAAPCSVTQLWDHDIEFARWQHPAMWQVA